MSCGRETETQTEKQRRNKQPLVPLRLSRSHPSDPRVQPRVARDHHCVGGSRERERDKCARIPLVLFCQFAQTSDGEKEETGGTRYDEEG